MSGRGPSWADDPIGWALAQPTFVRQVLAMQTVTLRSKLTGRAILSDRRAGRWLERLEKKEEASGDALLPLIVRARDRLLKRHNDVEFKTNFRV